MAKNSNDLKEETEKLKVENQALRQQLNEVNETIETIKRENIDALVIANEKNIKFFIEETADKPFRLLIENMHEGAVTVNEDGSILYCNSSFANMVNLPLQKITGTIFEKYIDDSLMEPFKILLKHDGVKTLKEEGYIFAEAGKMVPVVMTVNALTIDIIFVLNIIISDLTIQYEHQEKLKLRTKQLEEINKELAFQIEENEKRAAQLVIANKEMALAAELAIANKELAFQNQEKDKRTAELLIVNNELAFQIKEKEKREAQLNIAKTNVENLEGLNIHKETILATLSHDLRSPMAGIIQMTELLKDNFETMKGEELKKLLDILYDLSTDELSMLDYLVEWARIKYAAEAFSPGNIELVKYVNKAFDTLKELAITNNIQLYNEIKENITVFADKKMLTSILQNIISNSIKYTLPGGKVTVLAKTKDDKIIVEIKDTGIGISKEVKEKLFAPQMKALLNVRKGNKGAGIGLLLIKSFVDKNGGEIWVESIEGEGSSFYFTLPAEKSLD